MLRFKSFAMGWVTLLVAVSTLLFYGCPLEPTVSVKPCLESSSGRQSDRAIIDTVWNTVRVGVAVYSQQQINSIGMTITSDETVLFDTMFTAIEYSDYDTLWKEISFTTAGEKIVTITPYRSGLSSVTASIIVLDRSGPPNTAPTISVDDTAFFRPDMPCTLHVSVSDGDADQVLNVTMEGDAPGSELIGDSLFVWSPVANDTGAHRIVFIVKDNGIPPLSDTDTVVVVVTDIMSDHTPPEMTFVFPDRDSIVTISGTVTLDLLCSDASSVASVVASVGETQYEATLSDGHYKVAVADLPAGAYTAIIVTATDGSTNANKAIDTVYVRYEHPVTLGYDGNGSSGGSVPAEPSQYAPGSRVKVLGNSGHLVNGELNFTGWNSSSNGSGTAYSPGDSIDIGSADVVLYAQWTSDPVYTVTFDKNDAAATGTMSPQTIAGGSSATLTANGYGKPGWSFAGWATTATGTVEYEDGDSYIMGSSDVTLYAKWTANSYTITFDKNDAAATGTMSSQTIACGSSATLTSNGYGKPGWNFAGWATTATGTVEYEDGDSYIMGGSDVTLYARWTANSYTITFDKNDAAAIGTMSSQTIACGSSANLATNGFSRTAYTFAGWATAPDGSVAYNNGVSYTMGPEDVTLYAVWAVATYTVSFQTFGGTTVASQTVAHGNKATAPLPAPTRSGFILEGWYKEPTHQHKWLFIDEQVTSDVTLYVKWIVRDVSGNVYDTVRIGNQTWLAQNLKARYFNDGTYIQLYTGDNLDGWFDLTTPGARYPNDNNEHYDTMGLQYNWYTVNASGHDIAPVGWRVPTEDDWEELIEYCIANGYNYDGSTTDNKLAKAFASKTHWDGGVEGFPGNDPSTNNRTGLNAYPTNGPFSTSWWTSTVNPENPGYAFTHSMACISSAVAGGTTEIVGACSIRCILDH